MRPSQSSFRRAAPGVTLALLLVAAPLRAEAAEEPGPAQQALTDGIGAGDPAAVSRALYDGALPGLPRGHSAVLQAVEWLKRAPRDARERRRAVVEVMAGAADPAEEQPLFPSGGEASLLSRLAAVEGEEALFRHLLRRAAPERLCGLLRTVLWRSTTMPPGPVLALVEVIPLQRASDPACAEGFSTLAQPGERRAPGWAAMVEALLQAGIVPEPRHRPALIELAPPAEEGAAVFARLAQLDLSAMVPATSDYQSWKIPALRFLATDLLGGAARAGGLRQDGRWAALLEAQPEGLLCATLPEPLARGWSNTGPALAELAKDEPWREAMRTTLAVLLRRCPAGVLPLLLRGREGQEVARGLLTMGEAGSLLAVLQAGLQPAEPEVLAHEIACAGRPGLLTEVLERHFTAPTALLPPVMACLGAAEAPHEGEVAVLEELLRRGAAADTAVDGDTPIAIAEALGRADVAATLRAHGARPARLPSMRAAFWLHRRLAALAGAQRPPLSFEPREEEDTTPARPARLRLDGRGQAWLMRGECAMVNCDLTLILQKGAGYRVVLSANGDGLSVLPARHHGMPDIRVGGRGGAGLVAMQTWRFDGRTYQPFRCVTQELLGKSGRVQKSAFAGVC